MQLTPRSLVQVVARGFENVVARNPWTGRQLLVLSAAVVTIGGMPACGGNSTLSVDAGTDRATDAVVVDMPVDSVRDGAMEFSLDTADGTDGDIADGDAHVVEGGTDGPAHCGRTIDRASIRVRLADGIVPSCGPPGLDGGPSSTTMDGGSDSATIDGGRDSAIADGGSAGTTTTFTGTITGGDANSLVIDTCDGDPSCVPSSVRIEISAPGLDLTSIPRVRVEVKFQSKFFYVCQQSLEITTADPVDGSASGAAGGQLLLAVVDGGGPLPGSPYQVDRVPLGCYSDKGCGSPAPDDYAFDFSTTGVNGSALRVYMGQSDSWMTGGRSYKVRNLRSFQSTLCDDYWNFAYYVAIAP